MLQLRYSSASPYARKVMVIVHETGLSDEVSIVPTNPHQEESLRAHNPLCKVPTLVLEDGEALFDSPVIAEYLLALASNTDLLPLGGPARWSVLRLQALGDGICDAAFGTRMETLRADGEKSPSFIARQEAAMMAAVDWLEGQARLLEPITLGSLTVACGLGYMDFRLPHIHWRTGRPRLAAWYAAIETRPSLVATKPH
jgi:glutathione S-transferase